MKAAGPFEVKLTPQQPDNEPAREANIGRMSLDKQYHGDLEATGKGEFMGVNDPAIKSAAYVAMERVTGTLHGKRGSFVLQHAGQMDRGELSYSITVVPDTGTDELKGIKGKLTVIIEAGKHNYEFDYQLP
jgi:hypothetical protein